MAKAVAKKGASRARNGTGTLITINLKDYPQLLESLRTAAKADDRTLGNYLLKMVVRFCDKMLPTGGE